MITETTIRVVNRNSQVNISRKIFKILELKIEVVTEICSKIFLFLEDNAFIVQDDDRGDRRRKKHGKSGFRDQYLDEAKDIFGVEDIDDFYDDEGEGGTILDDNEGAFLMRFRR